MSSRRNAPCFRELPSRRLLLELAGDRTGLAGPLSALGRLRRNILLWPRRPAPRVRASPLRYAMPLRPALASAQSGYLGNHQVELGAFPPDGERAAGLLDPD